MFCRTGYHSSTGWSTYSLWPCSSRIFERTLSWLDRAHWSRCMAPLIPLIHIIGLLCVGYDKGQAIFKADRIDRWTEGRHPSWIYCHIPSYNDTNVSCCEVKKATLQSFALAGRRTYLIHYEYVPQEVAISLTFWEFYDFIYGSFGLSFILMTEKRFVEFH